MDRTGGVLREKNMTTSRIEVISYPQEETYTLEQFLVVCDLRLQVIEGKSGNWYCKLVGAGIPTMTGRDGIVRPHTQTLTSFADHCASPESALYAAAERLTRLHRLQRDDGTDINISNIKVVVS